MYSHQKAGLSRRNTVCTVSGRSLSGEQVLHITVLLITVLQCLGWVLHITVTGVGVLYYSLTVTGMGVTYCSVRVSGMVVTYFSVTVSGVGVLYYSVWSGCYKYFSVTVYVGWLVHITVSGVGVTNITVIQCMLGWW